MSTPLPPDVRRPPKEGDAPFVRAARLWNQGFDSEAIAKAVGLTDPMIANNLYEIRGIARALRGGRA